nr:PD-(D/E)XK nuclease family protein [Lachnospiraceae bacterium]
VFRYLRSGFSGVEDSDVDILENYVRAVGIRGKKRWSEEFTYTPGDLNVDIDHLNEIRQRFCDTVLPVNEGMKKKGVTVGERCEVLRTFFENIGIRETLESRKAYFEEQNDLKKADEYGQIYDVVDGLLEKLNNLLGDFTMSFSEFVELFDAGLEAVKIGIIPPGYDRVVVGDIERTRLNDVKALFLVGANDGNIPKSGSGGGIISESERELLKENDIELAPSEREDAFMQKFYLYMILTKSSEKLFVTFSRSGVDGTAKRRSYLIGTLLKLFNKLEILMPDMDKGQITYLRGDSLLDDIALLISEKEDIDKNKLEAVLHWIKNNKPLDAGRVMKIIKASTEEYKTMPLSKDVVTKIYGKTIVGSVTRLEKFAACEYAHFLYYGLKLRERAELSFGGIDIGNIIHGALERYAVLLKDAGLRWRDANEADSERILGEALRYSLEANHNLALLEDARSKYTFNRIERYMKRTVKVIKNQIKAGKFEPTEFEKRFEVNNIEGAKLIGTIDRIDTAEIDGEVYVNIIDYKTGKNELSFPDIYSGEQLQLSVYMSMALKMYKEKYPNKNVRPGGMFYYHVDDTIVNGNFDIDDLTLEKSLFTSYKLNGAIVDNPNVYTGMDFSLRESSQKSDIINVSTKKDGETGSTSSLYSEEVFEDILIYADEKSAELCESIFNGDIEVNPSKKPGTNGMSACTYCPMNSVCGFDEKIKGYSYKKSSVNGKDEALAAIIASIEE